MRCSARRPKEDMKTDAYCDDLCQRLQRCVDSYRNSEAGIRDFNQGRERPLHIRETEEAIEAIRTQLARGPKEDQAAIPSRPCWRSCGGTCQNYGFAGSRATCWTCRPTCRSARR
jgi:hypothetical protein